jgi:hypothetical protein
VVLAMHLKIVTKSRPDSLVSFTDT